VQETNPERVQLTAKMKREGARALKMEELRLRMESSVGRSPALSDEDTFVRAPLTTLLAVTLLSLLCYTAYSAQPATCVCRSSTTAFVTVLCAQQNLTHHIQHTALQCMSCSG
jgi:hypothetical protein